MITEIVAYEECSLLASFIAKSYSANLTLLKKSHFEDGETNLNLKKFPSFKDQQVLFVHQFSYKNDPINNQILDLIFTLNAIKKTDTFELNLLIPYLPYSRQEKGFSDQDLGLLQTFLMVIKSIGVNKMFVCDIHSPITLEFYKNFIYEIKLDELWIEFISQNYLNKNDLILASPDAGGVNRVERIAKKLNLNFVHVTKKRIGPDHPVAVKLNGTVENKTVVLIDDIIDTAQTAINACNILLKHKALKIIGCFSHGILSNNALGLIQNSNFETFVTTNSVLPVSRAESSKFFITSINDLLVKQLKSFF
ncbi:MAG: Ribose-phosphate pyrophosphokinase [candidate division TM6 bacterium GW2011_GWE2_31_21]|nr:MAG: Ribose-phosphate pyrophosphokinase [candidate division TM6 bacterium GW2011_GWE2_31_21]KKP53710.1 MAG: Ribose-phosphate pyrophosphokinase [candidate division TM6 bacterium GW2011_GWF2_33_332]